MNKIVSIAAFILLVAVSGISFASEEDRFLGTWNWDSAIGKTELKIDEIEMDQNGVARVKGYYVPLDHTQHRSDFWSRDGSRAELKNGELHILLKGTGSTFALERRGDELVGIFTRKGQDSAVTFYRGE